MAEKKTTRDKRTEKKVTRYTYENIKEPRTPETGHTSLLPSDERVVRCRWITVGVRQSR